MKLEDIHDKIFSIVIWNADDTDDVRVFSGIAKYINHKLFLESKDGSITIKNDWIGRIEKIEDKEISEILQNAEYSLSLIIGNLPENGGISDLIKLPIKWEEKA